MKMPYLKLHNASLIACFYLIALVLTGCTSDTELPPERPKGTITGVVVDGVISGAQVDVYGFGDGRRGARLGKTKTDDKGSFSVAIQARDQLILIETSGGEYNEQASGVTVNIPDDQGLLALAYYRSGEPIATVVTPLTHLVSALTQYKIENGTTASQAFNEAKSTINEFFTLDTHGIIPLDITNDSSAVNSLSDEALYGFYLASISNASLWASQQNKLRWVSFNLCTTTSAQMVFLMAKDLV